MKTQTLPQTRITKISAEGFELIKHFEDLKLSAYLCQAGVWTIGYGTTRYSNGNRVKQGDRITRAVAELEFKKQIPFYEAKVDDLTRDDITQNEFDALVSFAYNVGAGEDGYQGSSLRKAVNSRTAEPLYIEGRFGVWNKRRVEGVLKPSNGLTRRRKSEAHLYNTGELNYFLEDINVTLKMKSH